MRIGYFVVIFFFFSCSSPKLEDNETEVFKPREKEEKKMSFLDGIWAESEDVNAIFKISEDSIFYMENPESNSRFEIKSDTLIIYTGGIATKNLLMKQDNDSLVYQNEYGHIVRLYRR